LCSMKVQLKLIASYRDYLPPEYEGKADIDVPEGTTAVSILEDLGVPLEETVILIDGRTYEPGEILKEGNVVFAFHATAGG
jgi:sulfur carrier protein ThiS